MKFLRPALWLLAVAACTSCAGSGEGLDENARPVGEEPAPGPGSANPLYKEIQDTVFTPICIACHQGGNAPLGLRLDAASSYAMLVGVPSVQVPLLLRVEPGDPGRSYLVRKIEGTAATGGRMPLGGPALPQDRIDLIRAWIAAGASADAATGAGRSFTVGATVPAADEKLEVAPDRIILVFSSPVDSSLAVAGTLTLSRRNENATNAGEARWRSVALAGVDGPHANPAVLYLTPAAPLTAGQYRVSLRGVSAPALADAFGRVLDGDGDGHPGGDFEFRFEVLGGAVP
jgi:methionine-rich copper-binding protein CopC